MGALERGAMMTDGAAERFRQLIARGLAADRGRVVHNADGTVSPVRGSGLKIGSAPPLTLSKHRTKSRLSIDYSP
jgi:hypothetical protein